MSRQVTIVVEGDTDKAVVERLVKEARFEPGPVYLTNGKSKLEEKLFAYNNAAQRSCWLVLRDMDRDASCAGDLVRRLLPKPAPHIRLHIVVRAIEAWLLADRVGISQFFSVPQTKVPLNPETLEDPKRALLDLARQSNSRAIKEALLPDPKSSAKVGRGYVNYLTKFVEKNWCPDRAAKHSRSLDRLRGFLQAAAEKHSY